MTKHSSGNAGETPALHEPTAQVPTLAALVRSDYRLIGWGTGSVFDFYDEHYPLPLRYLIDNDARRHGEQKAGLTIQSSDALTLEDPARTVIVIYSGFWPEISRQIAALGSFQVIPITCLHNREWFQRQIESLNRATAAGIVRRPRSDNAIVIQGPVAPSETALVCRSFAVNYPDDRIILSTWDDTDAALLAEVRPFIDDLVLSRKPEIAGVKNRNLQIVSTRAGLERALQLNCRFAVKTRTDVLVSTGDVLNQCRRVLAQYDSAAAARFGLQGRILIPSSFTRKYLLYHPSDMFMAGNTADLLKFWDAEFDTRDFDLTDACRRLSLRDLSLNGLPCECYFGQSFARRIGWPVTGELADSWQFYRDLFVVTDNTWANLYWIKNPGLLVDLAWKQSQELIGHYFWQSLYFRNPQEMIDTEDPDIFTINYDGKPSLNYSTNRVSPVGSWNASVSPAAVDFRRFPAIPVEKSNVGETPALHAESRQFNTVGSRI